MSIPKVIHYCWFGGGEFSDMMKKCMESWKKFCPDYEIIEWNESNTDLSKCKYAQEALENKKWSYVSDYVRNYVIYEYGGIYLDTDVMLVKSLDPLLEHQAYAGWEEGAVATGLGFGAEKHNPIVYEFIQDYYKLSYFCEDGSVNGLIQPELTTKVLLAHGMENRDDIIQQVESFTIYPREYFCPYDIRLEKMHKTKNTYSIHYYSASWYTEEQKQEHIRLVRQRRTQKLLGKRLYKVWAFLYGFFFEGGLKAYLSGKFKK
ncbi:MAG: glycosyl transferase [Clostridia bacterium]|nr:glycosyl transferase [Clostridia bacterium]